jgi:hypothetical protein
VKILVDLSSREEASLIEKAQQLDVSPEDLAAALLGDVLSTSREDFARAAERVLQKNRELYRRLSR